MFKRRHFESKKHAHLRKLNNERCRRWYQKHRSVKAREKARKQAITQSRYEKKEKTMEYLVSAVASLVEAQKQRTNEDKDEHLL